MQGMLIPRWCLYPDGAYTHSKGCLMAGFAYSWVSLQHYAVNLRGGGGGGGVNLKCIDAYAV